MTQEEKDFLSKLNGIITLFNELIAKGEVDEHDKTIIKKIADDIHTFPGARQKSAKDKKSFETLTKVRLNDKDKERIISRQAKIQKILTEGGLVTKFPNIKNKLKEINDQLRKFISESSTPIDVLPHELIQEILNKADARAALNFGQTAHRFFEETKESSRIWRQNVKESYGLTDEDINFLIKPDESSEEFMQRAASFSSVILYCEAGRADPVDFFNQNMELLKGAKVFATAGEATKATLRLTHRGHPIIIETKLPLELLQKKQSQGDVLGIAKSIKVIDNQDVKLVDKQFVKLSLEEVYLGGK